MVRDMEEYCINVHQTTHKKARTKYQNVQFNERLMRIKIITFLKSQILILNPKYMVEFILSTGGFADISMEMLEHNPAFGCLL